MLPQVIAKGYNICTFKWVGVICESLTGLNVVEVAHDNCPSVKSYIVNDLKLINSYDTWHGEYGQQRSNEHCRSSCLSGTKNVAKGLKKIVAGAMKNAGKTWFPELSGKSKSTSYNYCHRYVCKYREKHKSSFILLHEELWWITRHSPCKYIEHC